MNMMRGAVAGYTQGITARGTWRREKKSRHGERERIWGKQETLLLLLLLLPPPPLFRSLSLCVCLYVCECLRYGINQLTMKVPHVPVVFSPTALCLCFTTCHALFFPSLSLSLSCVCVCAGTLDDGQQRYSSRRDYMLLLRTGFSSEVAPSTSAFPPGPLATSQALKSPTAAIVYDDSNHDRFPPGDPSRRAFTYFVLTGGRFIYASAIRLAVLKFVLSMSVRISHAHTHTHTCSHHMEPGCLRRGKSDLPPRRLSPSLLGERPIFCSIHLLHEIVEDS